LAFDADIFDTSNELVARIEQNEFHLTPGKYSYQKRPNRNVLIAFDKRGDILFAVHYMNPSAVRLAGHFVCSDHTTASITNDKFFTLSPGSPAFRADNNCVGDFSGRKPAFNVSARGFYQ
jgi:hypothetical protein